eukprot:11134087-Heterocapsa_arctica.AAC.1
MRPRLGGEIPLLASSPVPPTSGFDPGVVKIVRFLTVPLVWCPLPSVVLLPSPSSGDSNGVAALWDLVLGKIFSQRLTSQRN